MLFRSLVLLCVLLLTGLVGWLIVQLTAQRAATQQALQQVASSLAQQQTEQLQRTTQLVLQQLGSAQESQERTTNAVHTRLDHATKVVSDVQSKLGQLEEANKRIFDLGKDISGLQRILQAPKLRGTMGEVWLEQMLGQILPHGGF